MSESSLPTVSVVVPILNRPRFLVPTLESILQQDYPRVECIVVDGGSTDGTVDILKRYGDRIRWVSEPDRGNSDAINKGWWMSKGDILAWLNADDVYVVPGAISQAVAYLQAHPEVDVVYGDWGVIDEAGRVVVPRYQPPPWDLAWAVATCHHIIAQPASFIRRRALERGGWLDPAFKQGNDHELWLRLGLGGRFAYKPALLAYERATPGISTLGDRIAEAKVRLTRKFFSLPELPAAFREERFQRRALSNAHLRGALYAWYGGKHGRLAVRYVARAVVIDPGNIPFILKVLLWELGSFVYRSVLPLRWQENIRKARHRLLPFLRAPF